MRLGFMYGAAAFSGRRRSRASDLDLGPGDRWAVAATGWTRLFRREEENKTSRVAFDLGARGQIEPLPPQWNVRLLGFS